MTHSNTYTKQPDFLTPQMQKAIGNQPIVIGVSGGVDSMYLITKLLQEKGLQERLVIAHVHHGLRKESDEEYEFVQSFANLHGVHFRGCRLATELSSAETHLRDKRYAFYREVQEEFDTNVLFLGHHADDLTELILMRLVNGVRGRGLIGMSSVYEVNNMLVIRPLLHLSKSEIYEAVEKEGIEFREDMSNQSTDYLRNRYRNLVVPLLKEENNLVHKRFIQFSEDKRDEEDFITIQVSEAFKRVVTHLSYGYELDKEKFFKLHTVIQQRIFKRIAELLGESYPPSHTLATLLANVKNNVSSESLQLYGSLHFYNAYDSFVLMDGPFDKVVCKNNPFFFNGDNGYFDWVMLKREELNNFRFKGKRIKKYVRERQVPLPLRDFIFVKGIHSLTREVDGIVDVLGNTI